MPDFTDHYNQTADQYATHWDDATHPALGSFARGCGDGTILDAGCGPGRDLTAFAALGADAVGIDTSEQMTRLAANRGHRVIQGSLLALPFPDRRFAGVWASASLVHLDDAQTHIALCELHRVTRPGGRAHISIKAPPIGTTISNGWEGQRWFRYWEPPEAESTAVAAGWTPERVDLEPDSKRATVRWVVLQLTR